MYKNLKTLVEEEAPKHSWVETGTAIFSFFNLMFISISAAVCVGFLGSMLRYQWLGPGIDQTTLWYTWLPYCAGTGVAFVFAVLLTRGMYERRPSFVLAYFIFGVVIVMVWSGFIYVTYSQGGPRTISQDIGVCVVYTFVLGMVCRTYMLMISRRSNYIRSWPSILIRQSKFCQVEVPLV